MSAGDRERDPRSEAERVQRAASDPAISAAVSAAAGAGKTSLLVRRLLRLCLAGAEPPAIVAVTFTRKAAVEIKSRLLEQLRELAVPEPSVRRGRLRAILDAEPTPAQEELAGRLYDRFLEDLAGLPIGTIHAWCQRVLGRFAAELGLDPDFAVAEDTEALWSEALDLVEREVAASPDARGAWAALAKTPDEARRALTRVYEDRLALDRWIERLALERGVSPLDSDRSAFLPLLAADLRDALFAGTPLAGRDDPGPADIAPLLAAGARGLASAARDTLPALETGGPTAALQRQLDDLAAAAVAVEPAAAIGDGARADALARLRALLLTDAGSLRVLNGRKDLKDRRQERFAEAARPVLAALALQDLCGLWRDNVARLGAGLRALDAFEALKRRDRVVDFHDLERLARHLVAGSELAPYVQYRLDAAVAHLLVDEFQDTNHNQWDVLRPLVEEFLAGEGAAGAPRTLLVVGDVKQSIYRFRGAEPGLFARVEAELSARAADGECGTPPPFTGTLPTNFRSVPAVVASVSGLFTAAPLRDLLPANEADRVRQAAARPPGSADEVVVVPAYESGADEGAVDRAARAAAAIVTRLLAEKCVPDRKDPSRERPLTPADVLVLARTRTHIGPYEEALRRAGVRAAPSGRGALARSREVQDILQLLRWLAFPDDDVALASVLRSPLFRAPEPALQRALAARRVRVNGRIVHRSLWTALRRDLRAGAQGRPTDLTEAARRLTVWRRHAGVEPCHELLRRVYRDADAPDRFAAALGEQARWNLLRLHDLALQLDAEPGPSLRRFADLIAREAQRARGADEAAVPEHGEGRVSMMTVHGAKGLEAPAVILVDAGAPLPRGSERLPLDPGGDGGPVVRDVPRALLAGPTLPAGAPPVVVPALAAAARAARVAQENEAANLLYVALTRARDLLYVVGSRGARDGDRPNFLDWLRAAAGDAAAGDKLPLQVGEPEWLAQALAAPPPAGAAPVAPSGAASRGAEVVTWDPPPTHARVELRTPSALADADDGSGAGLEGAARPDTLADARQDPDATAADAAARGEAIHLWLRVAAEPEGARGIPVSGPDPGAPGWTADALEEARAVAENPAFARIFRPGEHGLRGLSEVPVMHRAAPGGAAGVETRVYGVIDRLLIGADTVEIIDYKSNGIATDAEAQRLVAHYRPQLAAYAAAAAALFPGRSVRAGLLFTRLRDAAGGQGRLYEI